MVIKAPVPVTLKGQRGGRGGFQRGRGRGRGDERGAHQTGGRGRGDRGRGGLQSKPTESTATTTGGDSKPAAESKACCSVKLPPLKGLELDIALDASDNLSRCKGSRS